MKIKGRNRGTEGKKARGYGEGESKKEEEEKVVEEDPITRGHFCTKEFCLC